MRKSLLLLALLLVGCKGGSTSGSSSSSVVTGNGTSVVTLANGKVQLNWGASSGVVTGYYVEQSTDGTSFSLIQTVSSGTSALITGATKGQIYYFRVRAYNSGGYSPYSSIVSVTP